MNEQEKMDWALAQINEHSVDFGDKEKLIEFCQMIVGRVDMKVDMVAIILKEVFDQGYKAGRVDGYSDAESNASYGETMIFSGDK